MLASTPASPGLTEFRSFSPNGDAQIVHMVPAPTSADNASLPVTTTQRRRRGRPFPDFHQQQHQPLRSGSVTTTTDPMSKWRRNDDGGGAAAAVAARIDSSHSGRVNREDEEEQEEEEEDDGMDDATSFSSLRVVKDQDKPSRLRVSEWRNSVLRRRWERSDTTTTTTWDRRSPSFRAASLLDEVGNAAKSHKKNVHGSPLTSPRILPYIPDSLPKAEERGHRGGEIVATEEEDELLGTSYPLRRKDARKRKEAVFSFFGKAGSYDCTGGTDGSGNFDPKGMADSVAKSLSFLDIRHLSPCGRGGPASSSSAAVIATRDASAAQTGESTPGPLSPTSALLSRFWICQEQHQGSSVLDTTILQPVNEAPDEINEVERKSPASSNDDSKNQKTQQRSQVALEVIKLRKELQRLKHVVQTKRAQKEMRDAREEERMRDRTAVASSPSAAAAACGGGLTEDPLTSVASYASGGGDRTPPPATTPPHAATCVRFAAPLVTQVTYRPYTEPEEIEKLYFVEEELNELERDRQTVAEDQFEVIMAPASSSAKQVRIAHQKRRLLALHPHEALPHSLSDLSVY